MFKLSYAGKQEEDSWSEDNSPSPLKEKGKVYVHACIVLCLTLYCTCMFRKALCEGDNRFWYWKALCKGDNRF